MIGRTEPRQRPAIALAAALAFALSVMLPAGHSLAKTKTAPLPKPPPERYGHSPHQVGKAAGIVVGVSGSDGFVLTNRAAVPETSACRTIGVSQVGFDAIGPRGTLVARDKPSGLVLLRVTYISSLSPGEAELRGKPGIRPGETVIAVGLPQWGGRYEIDSATGTFDVLSVPDGDRRFLRVTTPRRDLDQLGPLLDLAGNVVGMFIDRRGAMAALGIEREVPSTGNFAVGMKVIRGFLDAHEIGYRTAAPSAPLAATSLADKAYKFTVNVTCWD